MIRYQVVLGPSNRYIVFPAWLGVVPLQQTHATRQAAQEVADWLNREPLRGASAMTNLGSHAAGDQGSGQPARPLPPAPGPGTRQLPPAAVPESTAVGGRLAENVAAV